MVDLSKLHEPFEVDKIHWRVGSTTKDKSKGLALAYIDARDVMDRLDMVCGIDGWQCRYPHANSKTCCEVGIRVENGEWVWKSDGAGDTDFEGDKGAFSDAFKRAAVRWGVGRYLYGLPSEWVEIEQRGRSNVIKPAAIARLNQSIKGGAKGPSKTWHGPLKIMELRAKMREFAGDLPNVKDENEMAGLMTSYKAVLEQCQRDLESWWFGEGDAKGALVSIAAKREDLRQAETIYEGAAE